MSNKFTYEEVKKIINDLGYELLCEKYINSHVKMAIKDEFGYNYSSNLNNMQNGKVPSKYGIDNPYAIQNLELWLKLNLNDFYLVNATNYLGSKSKVILKDNLDYIYTTSIYNLQRNRKPSKFHISNSYTLQNIQLWFKIHNKDYILLVDSQYNGNNKPLYFKDKIGYYYSCRFADMQQGKIPDKFNKSNIFTIQNIKLWCELNNKPFELLSDKYLGSDVYLKWRCLECNDDFNMIWENIKEDKGCPECNKSKGEKKCKKWLEYNGTNFISQKEFDGLFGLRNGNLSYDFYLPKYNLLVEYQGEFHDGKNNKGNYYVKQNLIKQQEHDRRKKEYALKNGYNFLEIWYWDFNNIEKVLEKELNKYNL